MSCLIIDFFEILEVVYYGLEDVFIMIMMLVGFFLLMLIIYVKLVIVMFILLLFIMIVLGYFNKKMIKVNMDIYDNLGEFNVGIEVLVSGICVM